MKKVKKIARTINARAVMVTWVDSAAPPGWMHDDEKVSPLVCATLGWLVEKNKDALIVSSTFAGGNGRSRQSHAPLAIPRKSVVRWNYVD